MDQADFDGTLSTLRLAGSRPSPPAHVAQGLPAPGFAELDRTKGTVVLNFFATWCSDCPQEMPLLAQRASDSHRRFKVLAVDTQDDPSRVPALVKELGVSSLTIGFDCDGRLPEAYVLPGVPATFFLDGHHVVRHLVYGPLTSNSLTRGLAAARISQGHAPGVGPRIKVGPRTHFTVAQWTHEGYH